MRKKQRKEPTHVGITAGRVVTFLSVGAPLFVVVDTNKLYCKRVGKRWEDGNVAALLVCLDLGDLLQSLGDSLCFLSLCETNSTYI